jgi:enamine deaminase RidA (YjgF/YER057c/UK114 family)
MFILPSYDYKTGAISGDVAQQTEQTMQNIQNALIAAGAEVKDIVRVRYILPDRADFPKTWPVLQKWLGDVRPAATMIQAGLMEQVMKIEIEVTARKESLMPSGHGSASTLPL